MNSPTESSVSELRNVFMKTCTKGEIFGPNIALARKGEEMRSLRWRLFQEVRPYSWHLAALFSLGLLGTPLALLTPMPLKIAVDSVIGSHRLPRYVDVVLPAAIKGSQSGLLAMAAVFVI